MTQPFDSHESNYASVKGGASKKKVVKKSSTTKPKVVKKVKKPTKSTKKMKGGEETQGATGMPSQYFNASPPAKVISKTNVQPFDPVYVQNLATYNANGGKKTTKKPLRKPATKKPLKKKGGNSPFELANLLDFSPQEEGSGIMSDLMKFAKSATGGKKTIRKTTKKPVTKKCMKGCKCPKCMKKVVSKKKLIKKKVVKGGAKNLLNEKNLSVIWNSMFLKKIVNGKKFSTNRITVSKVETNEPYVVFFIDMQNDFMDVPYERSGDVCCVQLGNNKNKVNGMSSVCRKYGSEPIFQSKLTPVSETEKHSVPGLGKLGNFNVADAGDKLVSDIVSKLKSALNDKNCKKIYITRDYHPDGHMSFNPFLTPKPYCACKGGVFPAHCIQGHSGSLVIESISQVLKKSNKKDKVKVLFKGIAPNFDSFTALRKDNIDGFCSNTNTTSTKLCSSISGCYEIFKQKNINSNEYIPLTVDEALDFNLPISFKSEKNINIKKLNNKKNLISDISREIIKYSYTDINNEIKEIQVCGLAGDYCVRDTITALAEKFTTKDIVLLGGLTRYPVLPIFTMGTVPIHNYSGNFNLPTIDGLNYDLTLIKNNSNNKKEEKLLKNKEKLLYNFNNTNETNKSLYYYKLYYEEGIFYISKINDSLLNKPVTLNDFNLGQDKSFHFITPPEEIAKDYLKYPNIKIIFGSNDYSRKYVFGEESKTN